jgi:hypothetical protein
MLHEQIKMLTLNNKCRYLNRSKNNARRNKGYGASYYFTNGSTRICPEEQIIKDDDINDYKTKTELTRSKLVTTIIASLRSYHYILQIDCLVKKASK